MTQPSHYFTQFADRANAEGKLDAALVSEADIKHWSMDEGKRIDYQKDDRHTLSIYLKGGQKNFRTDSTNAKGAPGKICLMPQGQKSQWQINGKVEFVHLYFTDNLLKRYAAKSFDIDVRFVELYDLLFENDLKLKQLFSENILLCRNAIEFSPLYAEQTIHKVMHHLIKNYNGFQVKDVSISGGLSPYHIKFMREMIKESLAEKLTIEKLASLIDLSPFHFARMFKLSFGESPANYITRVRIDKAKLLLSQADSLVDISMQTGFNQQSHMTQHFRKITGLTPAVYRQRVM